MRLPRVAIDLDEVVIQLLPEWVKRLNAAHGTNVDPFAVGEWSMTNVFPGLTSQQVYRPLHDPDIYEHCDEVEGAVDAIKTLQSMKWDVLFVTSCAGGPMVNGKLSWLRKRGLIGKQDHWPKSFIATSRKGLVRSDAMIDDKWANFNDYQGLPILFDAPHNQHDLALDRMKGWGKRAFSEMVQRVEEAVLYAPDNAPYSPASTKVNGEDGEPDGQ